MLKPRWAKVIDDLWANKGRTILVVLAIAVGVMLFGTLFITNESLTIGMGEQLAETNPSTITMAVSPFDDELIAAVEDLRQVEGASGVITYPVQYIGADDSENLTLLSRSDYIENEVRQITPEAGTWPPGPREIVLERDSAAVVDAEIGDLITIELPDGQQRELTYSGVVHSLHVFPASVSLQMTGYVSRDTMVWLGQSGMYNTLHIATPGYMSDLRAIDEAADQISRRIEADGFVVGSISTNLPTENFMSNAVLGVTTFLGGIGVLALLLSAFLVINTVTAVLAQQKRQIGMLKAVGATRGQITNMYLSLVLAFGVLALVVSLPLGIFIGAMSYQFMMDYTNFNAVGFSPPLRVILMMAAASLVAPALAALWPVLRAAGTTVREAVSDYGTGSRRGKGLIDMLLARVRGLPRPVMLSLRNTFRRKGRLALTLTTLTLAGAMFIGVLSSRDSLLNFLDVVLAEQNRYDVLIAFNEPYQASTLVREAERIEGVTAAEGWTVTTAQNERSPGEYGPSITVNASPADTEFAAPVPLEGRWLTPEDATEQVTVITIPTANAEGVGVGDVMRLRIAGEQTEWRVVGVIGTAGSLPMMFVPIEALNAVRGTPGEVTELRVGTLAHSGEYQAAVSSALEEHFKSRGFAFGAGITIQEIVENNITQFNVIVGFMLFSAVLLGLVGGFGLASTMSLSVLERTREIGVMRGIGAGNGALRGIVLTEGLLIALMSWALGVAASIPVSALLSTALGVALFGASTGTEFSVVGMVLWLPVALVLASISSLLPARRASRISVREALAYE